MSADCLRQLSRCLFDCPARSAEKNFAYGGRAQTTPILAFMPRNQWKPSQFARSEEKQIAYGGNGNSHNLRAARRKMLPTEGGSRQIQRGSGGGATPSFVRRRLSGDNCLWRWGGGPDPPPFVRRQLSRIVRRQLSLEVGGGSRPLNPRRHIIELKVAHLFPQILCLLTNFWRDSLFVG